MNHILEDIKKFRELLNKTPTQLNEMFSYDQKNSGQAVPPQDKLGSHTEQDITKNPEDHNDDDHPVSIGETDNDMVNETEKVKVLAYNSGRGERLEIVSKDPKHWQEVTGQLRMNNGKPQLIWDEGGLVYADWHPQYGWVADFD